MTAAIRGEIQPYLDAIGAEDGSDAMIAAMEAVGTTFSIKEYTSTGVHEKYLIFAKGGVDFLLLDGIVDSVFFHLYESERYAAYAHVEALVDGLAPGMTRAEVIDLLGPARQDREHFLLYAAGDAFVNIQLDNERISAIDAQRVDLLAQAEADQAESVLAAEPKPITGEILPYLDAIGSSDGSDEMIAAMKAVGTKFTLKEYTSTGVHEKYLIFAKGGVDFLLHDGIVDTVFFHLRDSEKYAAYAHPDALVEGVRFGMSRDEVIDQLGMPRQNKKRYLLYPAGDAFVNIQFRDERVLRVNAQRQDFAAQAEAEQAESVPAAEPKPLTGEILQPIDAASSAYRDPVKLDLVDPLDPPQALDHGGTHLTAAIRGEILTYLEAIGSADGSDGMIAAMEAVGTKFTLDEYTSTGTREKYLCFEKGGVEFLLHDGAVETIVFYLRDNKDYAAYARPDALVEGVSVGTTRAEVIDLLGTPRQNRERFLLYAVGSAFVHFQIRDERVTRIAAMRADLVAEAEAADAAAAAPALAAEPKPMTGEISQLINAAGSAYGDPVMLDLVELLGPRLDSHDIDAADGGGKLLVFDSGVDLQYRDDVLMAVLIHVRYGDRRPYPRLDALVDGLAFPATREDVHAAVGEPRDSRSDLDLYEQQGTYVMFNYDGDVLATISIAHVPDDA